MLKESSKMKIIQNTLGIEKQPCVDTFSSITDVDHASPRRECEAMRVHMLLRHQLSTVNIGGYCTASWVLPPDNFTNEARPKNTAHEKNCTVVTYELAVY